MTLNCNLFAIGWAVRRNFVIKLIIKKAELKIMEINYLTSREARVEGENIHRSKLKFPAYTRLLRELAALQEACELIPSRRNHTAIEMHPLTVSVIGKIIFKLRLAMHPLDDSSSSSSEEEELKGQDAIANPDEVPCSIFQVTFKAVAGEGQWEG